VERTRGVKRAGEFGVEWEDTCVSVGDRYSDTFPFFTFCYVTALCIALVFFPSPIYTQYPNEDKAKTVFANFCKCIQNKKQKYLIFISIQTLCFETRNWAQVHPVSIDYPWEVSTTWLESNCGKLNWLGMIWKGTHTCLYKGPQLTVHVRANTKPWGWRTCP
jgi:hypothetical protein